MPTIIYSSPIYGPVQSRRLGLSLGINLMPRDGKVCTFDCLYCECGFNKDTVAHTPRPTRRDVQRALEQKLREMHMDGHVPDVLTFAGNGEPTTHPEFLGVISDTIILRDRYCPQAKIAVLSNATLTFRPNVRTALLKVDSNILKLDTVSPEYISLVNRPVVAYDINRVVEELKAFNGHCIVQTMFMKGTFEGHSVDNTTPEFVEPWINAVKAIKPQSVMVYTISRETPVQSLEKATPAELDHIVAMLKDSGIQASASY